MRGTLLIPNRHSAPQFINSGCVCVHAREHVPVERFLKLVFLSCYIPGRHQKYSCFLLPKIGCCVGPAEALVLYYIMHSSVPMIWS